ncbi:UNVERIFIED_CONTAM: hypothetical protein RMT77_015418 [Armadillidium vulgare]
MKKKRCFLLTLLFAVQTMERNFAEEKESCSEILASENYVIWTNMATFTSIFYHVFKTGCLVCTQPECNFSSPKCKEKWSRLGKGKLPVYNNVLEFGLSGKYFPMISIIKLYLNKNCYFKIFVVPHRSRNELFVEMSECKLGKTEEDEKCIQNVFIKEYWIEFDNEYCLYFGIAIFAKDRLHVTSSPFCNKFASANFNVSNYVEIKNEECYYNKDRDKPEVEYRFRQFDGRKFDGVPVILPCSPGGFAVDPKTGLFVTGKTCLKMFSDSTLSEGLGINFLIKNIYNNTEDLIFPTKDYRNSEDISPIYFPENGLNPKDRESMKPKPKPNTEKGNRRRRICEYEGLKINVTIQKKTTTKPLKPGKENKLTGRKNIPTECREVLSSIKQEIEPELQNEAINTHTKESAGCFVCAKPSGNKLATLSLPIYNKLFEFGFSGQYFPEEGRVIVKLNDNCKIKIDIEQVSGNITIKISECLEDEDSCQEMVAIGRSKILFNNWYCVQVALAFHDPRKLFYAFSFRCDKFAGSQLNETQFVPIAQKDCYKSQLFNIRANFELEENEDRNNGGVPIILPCNPGGYAVDSTTGRFAVNQTCNDMFWETLVRKNKTSGINFIIKEVFKSNENLLFKKRSEVNVAFPTPVYMTKNGEALPARRMAPKLLPDVARRRMIQAKCKAKKEAAIFPISTIVLVTTEAANRSKEKTTKTKKTTTETGGGGGAAAASGSRVSVFNYNNLCFFVLLAIRLD